MQVQEVSVDYTDCTSIDGQGKCADIISKLKPGEITDGLCQCYAHFELKEDMPPPVYFYYGLSNFYQNHRRYVKSRADNQLDDPNGKYQSSEYIKELKDCYPYDVIDDKPIAPCGAIANSLFTDSFKLIDLTFGYSGINNQIKLLETGISWPSDKKYKFHNPDSGIPQEPEYLKPKPWTYQLSELNRDDPFNSANNGYENEHLIVWMRTAALPTFKKLWGRVDHSDYAYKDGLKKGHYRVLVNYSKKNINCS